MKIDMKKREAFTLIELLIVISIMTVMAVLAAGAYTQAARAFKLSFGGQMMMDELNFARQTAVSRNGFVEVRYYKLPDYSQPVPAASTVYRAMQTFLVQDDTVTPVDKVKFLPAPVAISPGASESPFLSSTNHPELPAPSGMPIPGYGTSYRYRSFRFAPGGEIDLASSENSLTLVLERDKPLTQGANFFTIQADPISGNVRFYRP